MDNIHILSEEKDKLIVHTFEERLETGVPVCYLNEQGDTIIPYGKIINCLFIAEILFLLSRNESYI